jgi:hypothetical protein
MLLPDLSLSYVSGSPVLGVINFSDQSVTGDMDKVRTHYPQ